MAKLRREHVMIAREMQARAVSVRQIAAHLGVDESTLRYRLGRPPDAPDGRRLRESVVAGWQTVIRGVLERFADRRVSPEGTRRVQAQLVHGILVREYGFAGSYQAVRRYLVRTFGAPAVQAVRRVETPAGVQAQHDWFEWPAEIAGERCTLYGLIGTLSHSRATWVWASRTMSALAWQTGHLALFQRYGGVPLWVRIDNLKTAVGQGAGPTAVLTRSFQVFARSCSFTVDVCRPATPQDKGKVERAVAMERSTVADLLLPPWPSLEALQQRFDLRAQELLARRRCPATGTSVAEAWRAEQRLLQPLPAIHEPFDCVVARRVTRDCLIAFEGRRYSVPFVWVGRTLEVRGTARHVVLLAEGREIARHPRHTAQRLVLDPAHYEGASTPTDLAPVPLGLRARLQLAALPEAAHLTRPLSQYVALVEEACR
jgi:transposase